MLHGNGGCNWIDSTIFDTEASEMSKQQRGFTLIELIVVIVILGILAATALPRFVNLQGDARASSMKGLSGSVRAATELVRGKWLAVGSSTATTVDPGGGAALIDVTAAGLPQASATGIERALNLSANAYDIQHASPVTTFRPFGGQPAACLVTYNQGTGAVDDTAATAALCQ
jgi:MSHA pilin protein MshA